MGAKGHFNGTSQEGTDTQTDRQTDTRTLRLIDSIGRFSENIRSNSNILNQSELLQDRGKVTTNLYKIKGGRLTFSQKK